MNRLLSPAGSAAPGEGGLQRPSSLCECCQTHYTCAFLCSDLTINVNGLLTKTKRGSAGKQVTKATILSKYARTNAIDFIGIQELHLFNKKKILEKNFRNASKVFDDWHFDLISNWSDEGRCGGGGGGQPLQYTSAGRLSPLLHLMCAFCVRYA